MIKRCKALILALLVSSIFSYTGNLSCKCGCNRSGMDKKFLKELMKLERKMNMDFHVNSGFRCESYNRKVGGVSSSLHLRGLAVDISALGWTKRQEKKFIRRAKKSEYFTKVVTYYDSNHIHIESSSSDSYFTHRKIYKNPSNQYDLTDGNYFIGLSHGINKKRSIRFGYFDSIDNYNNIVFFSEKLITKALENDSNNHFSVGLGWSRYLSDRYDHYGLNLSMGLGEFESTYYFYYEPSISAGFIFNYFDIWINAGYILPLNSTNNIHSNAPGPNITLNFNVGKFSYRKN